MSLLRAIIHAIDWLLYGPKSASDAAHREHLDFLRWERECARPYDHERDGL